MRPGKVALLVGVLLAGSVIEGAYQVRERVGAGAFGWMTSGGRFRGPSFTYESEHSVPVAEGTRASVANAFGNVEVRPGPPGVVDVKLRKVVYLPNDAKARALADRLVVQTELIGGALHVTTNRAELEREVDSIGPFRMDSIGFETHLVLRVPPGTEVDVKDEHGDIDVAEVGSATLDGAYGDVQLHQVSRNASVTLRHGDATLSHVGGDLVLDTSYGDIDVSDVAGAVRAAQAHGDVKTARTGGLSLETQYGDLDADTVAGDLEVRGAHSAVAAQDVRGKADVESSYDAVALTRVGGDARVKVEHGEVRLTAIRGAASVETSYDDAHFEDIGGALTATVEHGAVHASRIAAGARVTAQGDDVVLDGFKGDVWVQAERGDVRLTPDGPLGGGVTAKSTYGDVQLDVPAGSRFELRAASDSSDLEISLPGLVVSETSDKRVLGRLGDGGGVVELTASHGAIHVAEK
jgi:DUF4097 and DUF4098 domain-containing protein YvlB